MRRVFGIRTFLRWKGKAGLPDRALLKAVADIERGLVDADLGGNVLKKRVALPGQGKRGSVRTIVATKHDDPWFFLYGFAKNERDNISDKGLKSLQEVAAVFLAMDDLNVAKSINSNELKEMFDGTEE